MSPYSTSFVEFLEDIAAVALAGIQGEQRLFICLGKAVVRVSLLGTMALFHIVTMGLPSLTTYLLNH